MSPMLDLQQRYRELGRIRLGDTVERTLASGKKVNAPRKLSEFRLTTASAEILAVAAQVYGGEVKVWTGAPTEGKQYELLTGTDRLDVLVPPGQVLSQHWEMWSGGGCERRCNGEAQTTGERCACPADIDERIELSKKGKACRPTTRLSVVLPRIPDIGVWRIESHGVNAAVEIPGTVSILEKALASGVLVPAQLRMDQRTSKKDGKTQHFVVPVLELPTITTQALMSAEGIAAIGPGRTQDTPSPRVESAASAQRSLPAAPSVPEGGGAPSTPPPSSSGGGVQDGKRVSAPAPSQPAVPAAAPATNLPPLPGEEEEPAVGSANQATGVTEPTADDWDREALTNRLKALPSDLRAAFIKVRDERGMGKIDDLLAENVNAYTDVVAGFEATAKKRTQSVVLACKKAGLDEDAERHAIIAYATDNACSSAKELSEEQAEAVKGAAARVGNGTLVMVLSEGRVDFLPADMAEGSE